MITEDKVTEIFCMMNDFCKMYDKFIKANGLNVTGRNGRITGSRNYRIRR